MWCASLVPLKSLLLSFKTLAEHEEPLGVQFLEDEYSIKHL